MQGKTCAARGKRCAREKQNPHPEERRVRHPFSCDAVVAGGV